MILGKSLTARRVMKDETKFHQEPFAACLYFVMTSAGWLKRAFSPRVQVRVQTSRILSRRNGRGGFTLVELLTVMAIIAIVTGVVVSGIPGIKGAGDINKAAEDISGALEQARTMAMAGNTYAWVGFFEENASAPGVAGGTGQVVISITTATDGTNLNSTGTAPSALPYGSLIQVNRLLRIPNLHLDSLAATDVPTRTTVPASTYQVANTAFANGTTFPFPLSATPTYNFTQVIQFNPQGDASRIYASPVQLMEIGLRPARGSAINTTSKDLVAIQIAGIGGKVTVYRP